MPKYFFALILFCSINSLTTFAHATLWQPAPDSNDQEGALFYTDQATLKNILWQSSPQHTGLAGTPLDLPLPDGSLFSVNVFEDNVLSSEISARHPELRSFRVYDAYHQRFIGRINFSPKGLHAIISHQNQIVLLEPTSQQATYRSFYQQATATFQCHDGGSEPTIDPPASQSGVLAHKRFGNSLRTYRVAISATHGYHSAIGQGDIDVTFAEMVNAINQVNFIFERDLGIRLIYASDTTLISTDKSDMINGELSISLNNNNSWIHNRFSGSYDIGHVLSTKAGGVALVNGACSSNKAQGATGLGSPNTNKFYFEYLAHEIAHQLGASHTFNAGFNAASCDMSNRHGPGSQTNIQHASYEPGSGSTIMSYAGICSPQNLQQGSDYYFHGASIEQIRNFVERNGPCGSAISSVDHNMPQADAGNDYIIPTNTPFMLQGSALDHDAGDVISYTWEQMDLGLATNSVNDMHRDKGTGPLIRSRPFTENPVRYIPAIDAVLEGNLTKHFAERLPSTQRTMNFKLTVRSGAHGVDQDDMQIQTHLSADSFRVTQPTGGNFNGLSPIDVRWTVADTDLPPILCSNVDISLTADDGASFTPIVNHVSNNGHAQVVLPNSNISNAYFKVQCSNNIFFNTSTAPITISAINTASTFSIHAQQEALYEKVTGYTTFSFTVLRTGDSSSAATVEYLTEGFGSTPATAEDFLIDALPWGELTFAAGDTVHRIDIKVRGDTINEPTEHFLVRLSNPTNGHTIAVDVAQNSILNGNAPSSRKNEQSGHLSMFFLLLLVTAFLRREAFS